MCTQLNILTPSTTSLLTADLPLGHITKRLLELDSIPELQGTVEPGQYGFKAVLPGLIENIVAQYTALKHILMRRVTR